MITTPAFQWILSAIFALTFMYAVIRILRSRGVGNRVAYALHALMSIAMVVMVWPWGSQAFLVPQIVVFTAATGWFVVMGLTRSTPGHGDDAAETAGHHDGKRTLFYHGAMMAAMAFMAAGMTTMGSMPSSPSGGSMGSMPGMDMSGGGGGTGMSLPLWVTLTSSLCAIGFGIASLYFLGSALAAATGDDRRSPLARSRTARAWWNLLMAVGMAALFVPMTGL